MPTNNENLTPEQRQRAEALNTAARIVAGTGPVFGPSPGVPEDRAFDVQEFARWIVKGDDDGAPAEDRHAARVGPIHVHAPEDGDPDVIRRLQEAARATGFKWGGVIHREDTENAGTAPEEDPETMGDHVPGFAIRDDIDRLDAPAVPGESFADRMTRLLVETGPTDGSDDDDRDEEFRAGYGRFIYPDQA